MQNKTLLHAHIQHYFKIFIVPLALILLCAATSPFYSRSLGDTSIKLSPSQQNKLSDAMKAQTGVIDTPTLTQTETPNPTNTASDSPDPTSTYSETPTNTYTETPTETPTGTSIETPTETLTDTSTETPTETSTLTPTETPTPTVTIETPELTPTPCEGPECPKPLMFIRNDGQYDPSIKFEMIGSNGSVVFTNDSILIAIEKPGTKPPWADEGNSQGGSSLTPAPQPVSENGTTSEDYSVVEIHFAGVNSTPMIDGENVLDTKISFFLGNDPSTWQTDIPAFTVIRYSGFAPGYDLEINGGTGTWVWKLVPNGNARSGLDSGKTEKISAKLNAEDGQDLPDLSLEVDGGDVSLEGDSIVVGTDAGNISLPLIQVPANTQPDTPTVDGNVVNSPYTDTGGEPTPTTMGYKKNGSNGWNQFLLKAAHFLGLGDFVDELLLTSGQPQNQGDASDDLVFSSFLGGAMDDQARDVAYGPDGSMYVTGSTMETSSWGFTGIRMCSGYYGCWSTDIFVARLNAQRQLASLTFIGGYLDDASSAIAVDESGNVYVVGNSFSPNFPMNSVHAPYQYYHLMWPGENSYATDIILFKLNPAMTNLLYATYLGGAFWEFGYGIAYDPGSGGNVYIVGDSDSPENYPPFIYSGGTLEKDPDGVLAGFNTNLGGPASMLTIKFFGGPTSLEQAHGVAVSPIDHSLWIIGQTSPLSGPVSFSTLNGFDSTPGGSFDAYIVHLAPAPSYAVRSSSFFGGSGRDCELAGSYRECDIAVDATGNAYITGTTLSPDLAQKYTQGGGFQAYGGGEDIFAAKVHGQPCEGNATAECMKLDYWRYLGGSAGDESFSIAVSAAGDAYITGQTGSPNFGRDSFPNTLVPDTTISGGDAFLVRLAPEGYVSYFTYLGGTGDERAYGVAFLESAKKAVIVGGMPQALSGFPLVSPVDSNPGTAWEGFVSEFAVPDWKKPPLANLTIISPTDWAAVVSLRPEFQWEEVPGADHYGINVYPVSGTPANPTIISKPLLNIVSQIGNDCQHPGNEWCFKWPNYTDFESGSFLTLNGKKEEGTEENPKKIGYIYQIVAYSTTGMEIGTSEYEYFQIPALEDLWSTYQLKEYTDKDGKQRRVCAMYPQCGWDTNLYWRVYDDYFYKWGEEFNIPPTILRAISINETASDGTEIIQQTDDGQKNFPPNYAYGYEPGVDFSIHFSQNINCYALPTPKWGPLDWPFFHFDGDFETHMKNECGGMNYDKYYTDHPPIDNHNCNVINPIEFLNPGWSIINGDCPFPYQRRVPSIDGDQTPVTIYYYTAMANYAYSYSNRAGLKGIQGCWDYEKSDVANDNCLADKTWMPAQYRTMASYGLGQVFYWYNEQFRETGLPPESLYDPNLGSKWSAIELSDARCAINSTIGFQDGWDKWKSSTNGYNADLKYPDHIEFWMQNATGYFPTVGSIGSGVKIVYPSVDNWCLENFKLLSNNNDFGKKSYIGLPYYGNSVNIGLLSPANEIKTEIMDEFEFTHKLDKYWVVNRYSYDSEMPGIGVGYVQIYSDQSKTNLIWQSSPIKYVRQYANHVLATTGLNGDPIIISQWAVGPHSTINVPIIATDEGFKMVNVIDDEGNNTIGFADDGGGLFPFPDGSITIGQRTYQTLKEYNYLVFRYDGSQYRFDHLLPPESSGDTIPPTTQISVEPSANEYGWQNTAVIMELTGEDNIQFNIMQVFVNGEGSPSIYSPLKNLSLTFNEGIWNIGYQSVDWSGNDEALHTVQLKIDETPPESTIAINGNENPAEYYNHTVDVELSAKDPLLIDGSSGSGVNTIEYSIGQDEGWTTYQGSFTVAGEGMHQIRYRSIDQAGNVEDTKTKTIYIDQTPPELSVSANPLQLWPPNNKLVPVRIFGTASDPGSGLRTIHIEVVDEYGTCQPTVTDIGLDEIVNGQWERTIQLDASRKGNDKDGRKYTIRVTATDNVGNKTVREIEVIVPHDQGH
jgi:hypothetical protein